MKKLLSAAFVFCAFLSVSNAQFAARAGVNLANISADNIEYSSNLGFHFGVTYSHMMSDALDIRPGLLFTMKGAKAGEGELESIGKFNYIEIPVDFVYKASALNVYAGPYLALLMSATSEFGGESIDVKDSLTGMDFGVNIGAEYQIDQIGIGANYSLGLANINDAEGDDTDAKEKLVKRLIS